MLDPDQAKTIGLFLNSFNHFAWWTNLKMTRISDTLHCPRSLLVQYDLSYSAAFNFHENGLIYSYKIIKTKDNEWRVTYIFEESIGVRDTVVFNI